MIIIDNFIKDQNLLNKFEDANMTWPSPYTWAPFGSTYDSINPYLQLINYIWIENSPLPTLNKEDIEGFEYWTGSYVAGDRREVEQGGEFYHLNKHFDKDESLFHRTGQVSCPMVGTIFYPCRENDEVVGGNLKIWETKNFVANPVIYDLIRPKFNRLIIFDASQMHAVTMVKQGSRKAVAINLWNTKPETFYE